VGGIYKYNGYVPYMDTYLSDNEVTAGALPAMIAVLICTTIGSPDRNRHGMLTRELILCLIKKPGAESATWEFQVLISASEG
jgi:hypothetical protein